MATIKGNSGDNFLKGTTGDDFIYGYNGLDILNGLGGNDVLYGGNGGDYLNGGAGNDTLDGGSGFDDMMGGSGDDVYIVDSLSDYITEYAGEGIDTIKTSLSYTLGENYINNLVLTGSSNLNGTGNSYDNAITGNAGNNTLKGNAGKDTLNGGNGVDTLIGGIGDDTYIVNSTTDVIVEVPGGGVDTVISSVSYTLGENYTNHLTLTGASNLHGTGNSYNNDLTGNDGDNLLKGGDGNDSIDGYLGYDTVYGEKGDDYIFVGSDDYYNNDFDGSLANGGEGNDTLVSFGVGYDTLYGDAGNDVLGGGNTEYGYVYMYGGDGNDTLTGVGAIFGGTGNDDLSFGYFSSGYGGLGNDTITFWNDETFGGGNVGFNASNEGVDTIINFESGVNEIYISASGFGGGLTGYEEPEPITSAQFKYGTSASTASHRFLYNTNTGYLRFDVDGSGSAASTVLAILQGAPALSNSDIYVN